VKVTPDGGKVNKGGTPDTSGRAPLETTGGEREGEVENGGLVQKQNCTPLGYLES